MSAVKEPRVAMLSLEEAIAVGAEHGIPELMAKLNVFRVLLRQPQLARAVNGMLTTLLFRGSFDARLRELVIMRIGWVTASEYEWAQHWRVATQLGIDEADLLAVRSWNDSDRFGDAERAILGATDETLATGTISRSTWERCAAHLGSDEERLELVASIGNWRFVSGLLRSLEIPLEEGMQPWPPDGERP